MRDKTKDVTATRIKVSGGLGNQLFRIIGGTEFCRRQNTRPVLDLSWYKARLAKDITQRNIEYLYFPNLRSLPVTVRLPTMRIYVDNIIDRAGYHLHSQIGYWNGKDPVAQTVRVLNAPLEEVAMLPSKERIRHLVELPTQLGPWLSKYLQRLQQEGPIALHMRLGDYLRNPEIYDVLSEDYYREAIAYITARVGKRPIWLYSDNPSLAQRRLEGVVKIDTVVDPPCTVQAGEILHLLSFSPAIVTAHSTFSWWGAFIGYLHGRTNHIVVPRIFTKRDNRDRNPLKVESKKWHQI